MTEQEEFEFRHRLEQEQATAPKPVTAEPPQRKRDTTGAVAQKAAYEAVAGVPDLLLNAPNRVLNLLRAGLGTAATAAGRPDLAPELTPDPDFARRALERIGLINPAVVPEPGLQRAVDIGVRGAVGGALTGGASIPGALTGAGMGMLATGAGAATEAVTGSKELGIAAGMAAPAGVARLFSGSANVRPEVRQLAKEGVSLTTGQIKGGALKRAEDAAASYPLLGDLIKARQREGLETFGSAAANRALAPIGERLPKGVTGRDAVIYTQDTLGAKYDSLLAKVETHLDRPRNAPHSQPTLRGDLGVILGNARGKINAQKMNDLEDIVQTEVVNIFKQGNGKLSGADVKDIESKLSGMATDMRRSTDYQDRRLAVEVKAVKDAVHENIARSDPAVAAELKKVDQGWMNFKRVQRAASYVGSKEGVFTPASLASASRALDKSMGKGATARGEAVMQDLSEAGRKVLSPTVPDSGTPFRQEVIGALRNPQRLVPGLLAAGAYSQPVQTLLQRMMLGGQGETLQQGAQRSVIPLAESQQQELDPQQVQMILDAMLRAQAQGNK